MNKNRFFLLLVVTVFSVFLGACGSGNGGSTNSGTEDQVYEFDLNFSASASSDFIKQVAEPWAQYVEEKSDGRLKPNIYSGAALGALSTGYEDIEARVYDAGLIIPGLHVDTDFFPLTIGDIPFLLQTPELAAKVLAPYIEKYGNDISKDVTYLGVTSTDTFQIFGQNPIKSVSELKNQKVSDSVAGRIELMKSLGATPVSIANSELYEALERGLTDYAVYTGVGAIGYKFDEVTKWMTKIDMGVSVMPFYINTQFLESLPQDLQDLMINDLGPKFSEICTEMYTKTAEKNVKTYEETVTAKGGGVYIPSEEEFVEWKAPIKKHMENWVAEANKRGYDGQAMMDYYVELLKAEGVTVPQ